VEKKSHTVKMLVISSVTRAILYLSLAYVGKSHDYAILKACFPPKKKWFKKFEIFVDMGFQGFADKYVCKKLSIPNKKKKKQELPPEQKQENKEMASERIVVEHSIGGMKRYLILSNRARNKDWELYNNIAGVCAGLWNFSITN
jgi:DDE superfamily endonuclease